MSDDIEQATAAPGEKRNTPDVVKGLADVVMVESDNPARSGKWRIVQKDSRFVKEGGHAVIDRLVLERIR